MTFERDMNADADLREGAVLFADVSGSTSLFQKLGDRAAFDAIQRYLETLRGAVERNGGAFVKSSGDDVLCWFPDATAAVYTAAEMMQVTDHGDLNVHAGLEWGSFVSVENDIFGDCVNTAARLCDLAKQRQLLVGEVCFQRLDPVDQSEFASISSMRLKGRSEASRIYSLQLEVGGDRTDVSDAKSHVVETWDAVFEYEGRQWHVTEGEALSVGREHDNRLQVPLSKVSRWHGKISITNGLVEYEDHSTNGSVVAKSSGEVLVVHLRTVVLSGIGTLMLGTKKADDDDAPRLFYEVVQR
jgi:adenylate cyclase